MRILALHGYHGSAVALRAQLAPLVDGLGAAAPEIVAIDAPARAAGDFGWWHARDGGYEGWSRTRDAIASAFAREGPFDGVLGFSQGAALTALLVGMPELAFRFALMIGGFASRDPAHAALFAHAARYAMPSLHVIGRADTIVPPATSRALAARFAAPVIVEHAGGHVIAATADVVAAVAALLATA